MEKFAQLVKDMRDAQKEYFRTRSHSSLMLSKSLEKRVDHEIAKFQASAPHYVTPPLPFK